MTRTRPLLLFMLTLAPLTASAAVVNFGSLSTFSGPPELDLAGTFPYAVNVGGPAGYSVAGLTFTNDSVAGCSITAGNLANPWGTKPEYGSTPDQDALENLMYSIRWSTAPNTVAVNLAVTPGTSYKLQLLFNENYWSNPGPSRTFDISLEGSLAVDELEIRQATGQWSQPQTRGTVYTHTFTAADSTLNILLSPGTTTPGDENPLINAFTLEQLPPPEPPGPSGPGIPEPAMAAVLGLGLLGLRKRR